MVGVRHGLTRGGAALALSVLAMGLCAPAFADWGGDATTGGVRMNFKDRKELAQIKADAAAAKAKAAKAAVHFEYASVVNCPGNRPDSTTRNDFCDAAALACQGNTPEEGLGPSVRMWRREVGGDGTPRGAWEDLGFTCFPEEAPNPVRPALTMQMVLAAFHDTAFARPELTIQPKGNVTLVTLPTYFQVAWPEAGFQPGEIDHPSPARMAGFQVEIRPTLRSVTYVYGDGTTSGPTQSLGGPYPTGDITRAYDKAGRLQVRADITYGGQFRVGGGAWVDIPAEVVVRGTPEPLEVRTAKARLVSH
ncbi:hypothetical protein RKE38_11905 [Phycicoccus sp. M110.8]|uniref:hypothetical protein n=1 Tax=Phycicoccus sp. M110.8 TaxID=3075433 RepID=UPI0028FDBB85|nr:hypothetical protein [Phycicoccus sp. M110.8]MDU0314394.1 hypothetical protein [Phycicoccus sp. M110.8]